jgi:hypothetical protein
MGTRETRSPLIDSPCAFLQDYNWMTVKILRWLKLGLLLPAGDSRRSLRAKRALLLAVLTIASLTISSPAPTTGVPFHIPDVLANVDAGGGLHRHEKHLSRSGSAAAPCPLVTPTTPSRPI